MFYTENLKNEVQELLLLLNNNIHSVESQGGLNLDIAYSLRNGLEELLRNIKKDTPLNINFIKKWNNIMAYCPRFFEGETILDLINSVDKKIIPENLRLLA